MLDKKVYTKVYFLLTQIPHSKVMTYGQIAMLCGLSNPRTVGYILHQNNDSEKFPCYKVVNFQGRLSASYRFGGKVGQKAHLDQEGIEVVNDRVDLGTYLWQVELNDIQWTYDR